MTVDGAYVRLATVRLSPTHSPFVPNEAIAGLVEARGWTGGEWDGLVEVFWDSIEDMESHLHIEEGRLAGARLAEDENNFIHEKRVIAFLAQPREVV